MVKADKDVISEFNEYVNMTAAELEKWLASEDSGGAGQPKDGADGAESVGQDSGHKIVEILKSNPDRDPEKYTEEQVQHMRKVAAYCKRHLAQEASGNKDKDAEEVKKTRSYISLKNWGHDFLKANGKQSGSARTNGRSKSDAKKEDEGEEQEEEQEQETAEKDQEDGGEEEEEEKGKKAGDKRKKAGGEQKGANKKRETTTTTRRTRSSKKDESEEEDDDKAQDAEKEGNGEEEEGDGQEEEDDDDDQGDDDGDGDDGGSTKDKPSKNGPKKGETVSWKWGSGNPKGKVLDVKEDKATIKTKRGNEVSRNGDAEDPAVVLDTGKSKAVKSSHELN